MLSETQVRVLCAQGEEVVVGTILELQLQVVLLAGQVAELERQLNQNSRNSSKPPSSDGYGKPSGPAQSRRKRGERKPGGQKGHRGRTLEMVAKPDETVPCWPERCRGCGKSLKAGAGEVVSRGQVFELPPIRLEVTEYRAMACNCPGCGTRSHGQLPDGVAAGTQYGSRMKGVMAYLNVQNLLPLDRTSQLLADLLGAPVGEGTIVRTVKTGARQLAPMLDQIWQGVRDASVAHFDETGLRVETRLQWLHVASTKKLTFYHIDTKRGSEAYDRMGILPDFNGTAVHDGYPSYRHYDCEHALCNAHHLRGLDGVFENTGQPWAKDLATLLREAQRWKVEGRLTPTRLRRIPQRYDELLEQGQRANFHDVRKALAQKKKKKGKLVRTTAQRLVARLIRDKEQTLLFLTDPEVPFDNNLAERDLRMMKVKQKVSGCFRTPTGADDFVAMRSYISTVRKQGGDVLEALTALYAGAPILPELA